MASPPHLTPSRRFALMLGLLLVLRLLAMAWLPLSDPTEGRYAEMARKMVETGNWLTPQFDYGVPFWGKPPLSIWFSAAGIAVFGPTAFAARLGILAMTAITLYTLWRWLKDAAPRIAEAAPLIYASSLMGFGAAAFVMTDMAMVMSVTLAMAGFWGGLHGHRGWGVWFFIGLGLAMLAKGPVAVVLILGPIVGFMCYRGGWRDLGRLPWRALPLGLLLFVPWYIAAEWATPGFLRYFIVGEHIERFLTPGWTGDLYGAGRAKPKGAIWVFWIIAALPWSVIALRMIVKTRQDSPPKDDGLCAYLLAFALGPMILFTPAANTLPAYVLPGLPAAAALGALLWQSRVGDGARALGLGVGISAAGFTVLCLMLRLSPALIPIETEAPLIQGQDGPLAWLGERSFTAEFAHQGRIMRLNSAKDAEPLPTGTMIVTDTAHDAALRQALGPSAKAVAQDRRYLLYQHP